MGCVCDLGKCVCPRQIKPLSVHERDMDIPQRVGATAFNTTPIFDQDLEVNINAGSDAPSGLAKPVRACTNCVRAKAKCSPGIRAEGKCERY